MAETKASKTAEEKTDMIKCKVIAKNHKLVKRKVISIKHNHVPYKINEGAVVELPKGVVEMLKSHKTKTLVPTGEKGSVKWSNFAVDIYHSFEVLEV